MGKNQYVVKLKNNKSKKDWGVKGENNSKMTFLFNTQKEAIEKARSIAIHQKSELKIQGRNNKFRDSDSYGNESKIIDTKF